MLDKMYSIAEARDQFATLIRNVEQKDQPIQVTRRGKPVAVILSNTNYERLMMLQSEQNFWQSYQSWRTEWQIDSWEDNDDPFVDLRDQSPGRTVSLPA